ncbi:putative membrane protein [Citrobacter rodentium ICC168]|uniref:Membrane protein n=1 Tax=Citrobacter rodentium (strain ICC168) TaxID=637910 RepID=D2TQC9_CITRI|nr:putative membrane protein [Citrobacter rodentium ICC168]
MIRSTGSNNLFCEEVSKSDKKKGYSGAQRPVSGKNDRRMKRRPATPCYFSAGLSCSGLLLIISHSIESSINLTLKGE